jgi:hypothetical protein
MSAAIVFLTSHHSVTETLVHFHLWNFHEVYGQRVWLTAETVFEIYENWRHLIHREALAVKYTDTKEYQVWDFGKIIMAFSHMKVYWQGYLAFCCKWLFTSRLQKPLKFWILRYTPTDIPTYANISWIHFHRSLPTLHTISIISSLVAKLTPSSPRNLHWHLHGHHENVYAIRKSAFSSLSPYRTILQAFIMYLRESCIDKHKTLTFARIFKYDEPTIHRNKQLIYIDKNAYDRLALKWRCEWYHLLTPKHSTRFHPQNIWGYELCICGYEYYFLSPHNDLTIEYLLVSSFLPLYDNFDLLLNYCYYYYLRLILWQELTYFITCFQVFYSLIWASQVASGFCTLINKNWIELHYCASN